MAALTHHHNGLNVRPRWGRRRRRRRSDGRVGAGEAGLECPEQTTSANDGAEDPRAESTSEKATLSKETGLQGDMAGGSETGPVETSAGWRRHGRAVGTGAGDAEGWGESTLGRETSE